MSQHNNNNFNTSIDNQCFINAVKFLNIRDHSRSELITKLKKKGYKKKEIDEAINRCLEYNYLDDAKFAQNLCNSLIRRLNGSLKIKNELLKKKIDPDIIEELMAKYQDSNEEFETAKKYFLKNRYKFDKKDDKRKRIDSYLRSMNQRGFSKFAVYNLMDEFSNYFQNYDY